ncbi:PaaI family thioesterase [Bradyrhizobium sp. ORS 111]|uniref:PaaI family thioesterase n=1 Tax=Bradyrhizobium sp. ORS 111 TaxID=1685958 RepID=UPI00388DD74A
MATVERLKELVEGVTARAGYSSSIGTRVLEVRRGEVTMALDRRSDLQQVHGQFHGGVIAGLADHAAGAAVTTAFPEGKFAVTVDLHVNFLAPALGDSLIARAKALRVGGTIGVSHVDVYSVCAGKEEICAVITATMRAVDFPGTEPARHFKI